MKASLLLLLAFSFCGLLLGQKSKPRDQSFVVYPNRAPLFQKPFIELPLGAIKPAGWLKEMLIRQKTGATGQLDKLYPIVMGKRNGWLGGDGDQWERGPYWIDGLLPLAYILDDDSLKQKVQPWIEWSIKSQQPNGYFGPSTDYGPEPGLQRNNSQDWWPKMVMLKVLMQYYSATGDERVVNLMTNYFRYQLNTLPTKPLDNWTFWAHYRGGDNLLAVYWLYNITGDAFLLQLADLVHSQTFDYTHAFLNTDLLSTFGSIHCVNLAQGFKAPAIYYQQHPEEKYLKALEKGMADLNKFNGYANGMYGGDEGLHGNNPTQGSELCSAVEMMYSLENILSITGNTAYADQLERIAFNALPAQASDNYMERQYFQQTNQVMATRHFRNFDINHHGTDLVYGLLTGYPCCTSNMHQGWPKFTQNLWYATPDSGLAALVYSPSEVTARVNGNTMITITEQTNYPFGDEISFTIKAGKKIKQVNFPLSLRIPAWCKEPTVTINGQFVNATAAKGIITIRRDWKPDDKLMLKLPMTIHSNLWYENAVSVERGPLVYALKMKEEIVPVTNTKDRDRYGNYLEVRAASPWNYGLMAVPGKTDTGFVFHNLKAINNYPWNLENAPLAITTKARRIPSWKLYNEMTGPIPFSNIYQPELADEMEEITLVPYGCTQLRISQFPVVRR